MLFPNEIHQKQVFLAEIDAQPKVQRLVAHRQKYPEPHHRDHRQTGGAFAEHAVEGVGVAVVIQRRTGHQGGVQRHHETTAEVVQLQENAVQRQRAAAQRTVQQNLRRRDDQALAQAVDADPGVEGERLTERLGVKPAAGAPALVGLHHPGELHTHQQINHHLLQRQHRLHQLLYQLEQI